MPIAVVSTDGRILEWNQAATTVTGVPADQAIGAVISNVIVDEVEPEKVPTALAEVSRGKILKDFELHLKTPDERRLSLLLSAVPLHDDHGNINRVLAIGLDMTDHLLAEQRLAEAAKMETLGEVATGLSHEMNQPLGVVRVVLQNLKRLLSHEEFDRERAIAKLARIDEQVTRASELVAQIRLLGKNAYIDEHHSFPLSRALTPATDLFVDQLAAANIEFSVNPQYAKLEIYGNEQRLEAVLIALLANARDAVRERWHQRSGGWIRLTTLQTGHTVEVVVEDNGGGVPAAALGRVFEPFFTTKSPNRGAGLGLAVSQSTVAEMGGAIKAENIDRGFRVTISLPIRTRAVQAGVELSE